MAGSTAAPHPPLAPLRHPEVRPFPCVQSCPSSGHVMCTEEVLCLQAGLTVLLFCDLRMRMPHALHMLPLHAGGNRPFFPSNGGSSAATGSAASGGACPLPYIPELCDTHALADICMWHQEAAAALSFRMHHTVLKALLARIIKLHWSPSCCALTTCTLLHAGGNDRPFFQPNNPGSAAASGSAAATGAVAPHACMDTMHAAGLLIKLGKIFMVQLFCLCVQVLWHIHFEQSR